MSKVTKYVIYEKLTDHIGNVQAVIQQPYPEQIVDNGMYIERDIPQREEVINMDPYLRINLETQELYYDYIARETFESRTRALQAENDALRARDIENRESIASLYEMLLKEANA
ncbi:hypothetical protein DCC85_14490 [Paenibacillus sp. CAA11]|uniref:hypothetical protein n=1 Tax=Paenibacillus sp. CAA11 TaxID=1532905 RepID=UPI000D3888A8|nr:hypothetical protein [Paenibacillus sp. CAA11]AWB45314.1 hypothetical protein DCC85_14490 [Paenibacillus sp. CAA11]